MKEIFENLYVGNQLDYERGNFEGSFLFAAKEPFHRQAVGYSGRACSKTDPEYLYAERGDNLILNLVDASSSLFFNKNIIDMALNFIEDKLKKGRKVYIICNCGISRSASLGLLYLIKQGIIQGETLEDCEVEFLRLYPEYNPGKGIRDFIKENFELYKYNLPF